MLLRLRMVTRVAATQRPLFVHPPAFKVPASPFVSARYFAKKPKNEKKLEQIEKEKEQIREEFEGIDIDDLKADL